MVSFYEKLSFHLHNSFYISFFHISFSQFIFSQFIFSQFIFKVSHVEGNEVRPPEGIGDVLSASVDITTPETINLTTDPSVSLAPSSNSIITTTTDDNKPQLKVIVQSLALRLDETKLPTKGQSLILT